MGETDGKVLADDQHARVRTARAAIANLEVGALTDEESDIARDALHRLHDLDEALAKRSGFDAAERPSGGDD